MRVVVVDALRGRQYTEFKCVWCGEEATRQDNIYDFVCGCRSVAIM